MAQYFMKLETVNSVGERFSAAKILVSINSENIKIIIKCPKCATV